MNKIFKLSAVFHIVFCLIIMGNIQCLCVSKDGQTSSITTETIAQSSKASREKVSDFDYLISCGYPKELLDEVTDSSLENIVASIGNGKITRLNYRTEYYPGNEKDGAKVALKIASAEISDAETENLLGKTVCIYWEWINKGPFIKEEDFLTVKWNKDFFCYEPDSFFAEDYCKKTANDDWTTAESYTELARLNVESLGHWTALKKFDDYVGGCMVFQLTATSPINKNTDYDDSLIIEYTHQFERTKIIAAFVLTILAVCVVILAVKLKRRKKG